jgi:hypothetical protein
MMRTKSAMVRSVTAMVAAVGSLVCLAGPAEAFDSGTCNNIFGPDNVDRVHTFKIDTGTVGKVDFGDHLHLWGAPQGTAVVCFQNAGAVAVKGYLYADTPAASSFGGVEYIFAKAKITYFSGDVVRATSEHSFSGGGAASKLVNELKSGVRFTRVRLKLFRNETVVQTQNFNR